MQQIMTRKKQSKYDRTENGIVKKPRCRSVVARRQCKDKLRSTIQVNKNGVTLFCFYVTFHCFVQVGVFDNDAKDGCDDN